MTPEQIRDVLDSHARWLAGESSGSRANLARADLDYANLARANLARADLTDANLTGANLTYAHLARADLTGANLTDAHLDYANLARAYLAGADLADANLELARLPDGWVWWQGGASGPHRRQMRVWAEPNGPVTAKQGCIVGTPDAVTEALRRRAQEWATQHNADLATMWLAESMEALACGIAYVDRRRAHG